MELHLVLVENGLRSHTWTLIGPVDAT
jgi:hypothetical protein